MNYSLTIQEILKKYWGYNSFRNPQEEIIQSVLSGKDNLVILPTGAGKSVCFQIPAIFFGGTTLVISPLIALMTDQVIQLKKKGINAEALHSGISKDLQATILSQLNSKTHTILYLSPEKLNSLWFQEQLQGIKISLVAIDEAHCISQWGYDFRTEYLSIKEALKGISCPKIALTASATPEVQQDIKVKLGLESATHFSLSTYRANLSYKIISSEDKEASLIQLFKTLSGTSIVYLKTRKMCHEIADLCTKNGISNEIYHAGLSREQRTIAQDKWISNEKKIMLATNAFGMGIDKPDVRNVVHYGAPNSLEAYYQEAGRAGRDGLESAVYLLNGSKDKTLAKNLLLRAYPSNEDIKLVFQSLCDMLQIAEGIYTDEFKILAIEGLKKRTNLEFMDIHYCLKMIDLSGIIKYEPDFNTPSKLLVLVSPNVLFQYYDQNPNLERILKAVIRLYGAQIYDTEVHINETTIAKMAESTPQKVYDVLLQLHKNHIIHYFKGTDLPVIQFLIPRPSLKSLPINHTLIAFLKERAIQNLENIYAFIETPSCKQNFLTQYFGGEITQVCGTCSSCKKLDSNLIEQIAKYIKEEKEVDLPTLKSHFHNESSLHIAKGLEKLLLDQKIIKNKLDLFVLKN